MLERYHRELLNFLTRQVKDRHVAADLAQESYVRVLNAQSAGQPVGDPRALLYQVARNLMVDQHRRAEVRRHEDLDDFSEDQQPLAPAHLQPDNALASQQVIRAHVSAIEGLPPRCREAFVLHVFDDLPHAEVARRMGISISMVEKHVVRGMLACRQCERALQGDAAADIAAAPAARQKVAG
jgi:RNA polymerase sigma-70 factor (ECF subfamily)